MSSTTEERLIRRRTITPDGCWEWDGYQMPNGYGLIFHSGAPRLVHRAAYEVWVGPIPDGLCILHRCDNRACFNPKHLWLGTVADNQQDMAAKGRGAGRYTGATTCIHGHPLDGVDPSGTRYCRTCKRERARAYRARRRANVLV